MIKKKECTVHHIVSFKAMIGSIVVMTVLSCVKAYAGTIVLDDTRDTYDTTPYISMYEDKTSKLSVEDIIKTDLITKFQKNTHKGINKGYSDSSWWFYFSLHNRSSHTHWLAELSFPTMDYFEVYSINKKGFTCIAKEGDIFPFGHRKIALNNFILPLTLHPNEEIHYLLRVKTTSEVIIPLTIRTYSSMLEHSIKEYSGLWFYFGIMIAMFLYNLFLLITLRDINYLYYILYVIFSALSNISFNGIAYQFFWPDWPWFHNISIVFLGNLAIISFMLFTRNFLMTRNFSLWHDILIQIFIALIVPIIIVIPLAPLSFSIICLNTVVIIATLLSFIACVIAVRNKYKPAYFYLASMIAVFLGVSLISMRNFGILPDIFITRYGFHIGTSIDVILLSMALGYRYNLIKDENEKLVILKNEIEIARTIYDSIVQTQIPELTNVAIETVILPTEVIGGDIVEIHSIDEDTVGIFIADISGHGIPASIGAAMVKMACAHASQYDKFPDKYLMLIANTLSQRIGNQFVTAVYTVIDTKEMTVTTSNAGHYAMVLCKANGPIVQVRPKGGAIGFYQNPFFAVAHERIGKGDRIVLFTDGIIESRNTKGDLFGEDRLMNIIREYNGKSITALKNEIIAAAYRWIYPHKKFDDDFTLVIVDIV